ncbi:hypothetical protein [Acetobacter cerevisiae]|uniref:hypothetical protein n=1 Tax=Acetobacter cerevisiae TaxID=178900 RepID=UPI0020A039C4|nr:hypothetical protein [Acetobacter cerevisiae]MCP1270623.1 hypothetical protein [Acetobacter cerevisiae]MCP1278577.1 hypothetical protein [Acetobacter cerevisiae]
MKPISEEDFKKEHSKIYALITETDNIKETLILSSLFSILLERFKKYIIETVDSFFASDFEQRNGKLTLLRGNSFKDLIKKYGKNDNGKHNCKDFRACTYFFLELGYMSQEDVDTANRYYDEKNNISHELYEIIADDKKQGVYIDDILTIYTIYKTVVRHWIREVEATTGMIEPEDYDNYDFDNAETIETILLWRMIESALKGIPAWDIIQETLEDSRNNNKK